MACLRVGVVVLLAASLLAFGADLSWMLERLSHLRLQLLLATAVLLPTVVLLGFRRWRWMLLLVVSLAINAGELARGYGLWPAGGPLSTVSVADEPGVRVFYANLLASNPSADRLTPQLDGADADLLILLELTPDWERRLEGSLARFPHRLLERREDNFGLGIYSTLPLRQPTLIPSAVLGFDLAVPLGSAVVDAPWGPLRIVVAHPVPPTSTMARRARDVQLMELAALVADSEVPTVVVGDLNTTVFVPAYQRFIEASGLRNALVEQPQPWLLGTWPAGLPVPLRISIDHCLVSSDLAVSELEPGRLFGSDHLPLVIELNAVHP